MVNFFKAPPAPRKKRKRLNPVSKKRAAVNVQRSAFVKEQLAKRPRCEAGNVIAQIGYSQCTIVAVELHEPLTRARAPGPETITNPKNSVACCQNCHGWIHRNPEKAELIGLLKSSRDKT